MAIATQQNLGKTAVLGALKSFLIWALILEVSFLVVGFPLVTIIAAGASLLAVALQCFMSASAVLLVAGTVLTVNLLGVFVGAALLTLKGVHPQDVSWLDWLHQDADPLHQPIYASCPLTCDIHP